jgi:hypothetical protein
LRTTKFDTEEEMNAKLASSGRKALVHDAVYQKIQECVGYKSKDVPSVLEPLLATEYYISNDCVRTSSAEASCYAQKITACECIYNRDKCAE